jgi:hypothetical protein
MNMWIIGIWVLLIHDASDFWLILGRGYVVNLCIYYRITSAKTNLSSISSIYLDLPCGLDAE